MKLTNVIKIIGGGTPKRSESSYWEGYIPWLSVVDFNNGNRYVNSTREFITREGLENSSTKLLDKGMIIISARGTVGALAQLTKPMAFNQSCYGIAAKDGIVINDYLYYLLKFKVNEFKQHSHGSVFDTITRDTFANIEVTLPSLTEQKRIAAILGSLDDKIEINRKMNENLEQQSAALFKHWFVDFEFPDPKGNPYRSTGGKLKESSLGMIPEEWSAGVLENIASIASGKRPTDRSTVSSDEANIPLLGASSVMGYTNQFLYDERILVIGRVGTHGVIQRFNKKCWPSDNTLVLKCNYYEFLYHVLKSIDYNNLNRGSTQPLITQNDVKNTSLVVPSADILKKFEKVLYSFMHRCAINDDEIAVLSEARDRLLIELMNN